MDFKGLFSFLERLQENNSKAWMDEHRKEYHSVRDFYIDWLNTMNFRLAETDALYFDTPGKKAINRINNNLLYHPNLPTYKDHFGAGLDQVNKQGDFYIQIGCNESFIASGYWKPKSAMIKSIREALDYNGEVFQGILDNPKFSKTFGPLAEQQDKLSQAPQGYDSDHKHIELLKNRSFVVFHSLSRKDVCSPSFNDNVVELYETLLPFRRYLNQAVTV